MYYLYGITKLINGPLHAVLCPSLSFADLGSLSKFMNVPQTIMAKELSKSEPHGCGFIIYKHTSGSLPKTLPVSERPFQSERLWPYTPLGEFVKPKNPADLSVALIKGYSYKEAAEVLNTCQPAIKRCIRKELNDGVDVSTEPGIIEARADEFYFLTRYTPTMPSKITV